MRVLHIIPSAFEYFDDIRSKAFNLVNGLHNLGVETEVFTLQYGSTGKSLKESVKSDSPAVHEYINTTDAEGVVRNLSNFDLIHLHTPFLGMASHLLRWKKSNPDFPFVVTYHRDVPFSDVFSLYIKLYNAYFLPKIFAAADRVVCASFDSFRVTAGARYMPEQKEIVYMDQVPLPKELQRKKIDPVAAKMLLVYNTLLS